MGTTKHSVFREEFISEIKKITKLDLNKIAIKQRSFATYSNEKNGFGLICPISKEFDQANKKYWFSIYPYQKEFLEKYRSGYIALGCGTAQEIIFLPITYFVEHINEIRGSKKRDDKFHWFLLITNKDGKYYLQTKRGLENLDISKFLNKCEIAA